MPTSVARSIGELAIPEGTSWTDVVSNAPLRAKLVLAFHEQAASSLGLAPASIQLHQMMHRPGLAFRGKELDWHRDACLGVGHVQTVLGDEPTEYLLGDYPESFLTDGCDLSPLAESLQRWQPRPGTLVWLDRFTIHRRPLGVTESLPARLFLLATRAVRAPMAV